MNKYYRDMVTAR